MGQSWCILCYWVLELPVRLGKGLRRTHGPPLPSSLHTQNGVMLERYPTCSLRNNMLLKSHWDPRILSLFVCIILAHPVKRWDLAAPKVILLFLEPTCKTPLLQTRSWTIQRLFDSLFISILGWEVGCKRRRKVFLKFP